ncbi:MAG: hypothetical protein ACLP3B_07755 [Syntrophobacteraceae bacterium]
MNSFFLNDFRQKLEAINGKPMKDEFWETSHEYILIWCASRWLEIMSQKNWFKTMIRDITKAQEKKFKRRIEK